jgi:hypothetical protein
MSQPQPDPPAEQLLAALDRALRHRRNQEPGVLVSDIVAHLGLPGDSRTKGRLRVAIEGLEAASLVVRAHRYGVTIWTLTETGSKQLAEHPEATAALPESPQHRLWREARTTATRRIEGFREDLLAGVAHASDLLESAQPVDSESWYTLGEWLSRSCQRLGSATHCLNEWAEPNDAQADIDTHPRRGRRTIPKLDGA